MHIRFLTMTDPIKCKRKHGGSVKRVRSFNCGNYPSRLIEVKKRCVLLSAVIFGVMATLTLAVCLQAQESPEGHSGERQRQDPMLHSGALVGLSGGQTLWIAPVQGKIRITENQDYVIPRKNGFWRIRIGVNWAPRDGLPAPTGYRRLWSVPLTKGNDAVPWTAQALDKSKSAAAASESPADDQDSANAEGSQWKAGPDEDSLKQEVTFLSPNYVSFYETETVISSGGGTGGSEIYRVDEIADPPSESPNATGFLLDQKISLPIPENVRSKDLEACIDPKADFRDETFLQNVQEPTDGIHRNHHHWEYGWLLGYSTGAARGYHTECPVSLKPPKSIVGYDELFPAWKTIRASYPNAEDAFSSPTHDLILLFAKNELIVAPLQEGRVGKALAKIQIDGKPVMVQWATGKYVDAWTEQLTPYFETYMTQAERDLAQNRRVTEPLNERGMSLMNQGKYEAATAEFVKASQLDKSCNPQYPDNAGNAYYKVEDYSSALAWIGGAMSCDPKYAIAYLNRGDAFVGLYLVNKAKPKHDDLEHSCRDLTTPCAGDARSDYQTYLELAPTSNNAAEVKNKIDALPHSP